MMQVNQTIILYPLNSYGAVCQLYFNNTGRKKKKWLRETVSSPSQVHMVRHKKRVGQLEKAGIDMATCETPFLETKLFLELTPYSNMIVARSNLASVTRSVVGSWAKVG